MAQGARRGWPAARSCTGTAARDAGACCQRDVFVAIVLNDVPLETLVIHLGSSRNAIYQAMFEARRKLRAALVADGYLGHDTAGRS